MADLSSHPLTSPPLVALIGRPNVGKSTLFNRLAGERLAIESEEPGTTRDRLYTAIDWRGRSFLLIDCGGLTEGASDLAIDGQVTLAIEEADLVLLLIDASADVLPEDRAILARLRKQ